MSKAIVCLTAGSEFYSKAIRKLTHSNVNHAFIAYTSQEWGGWWAIQVDERGVIKVPVKNVEWKSIECYEFPSLDLSTAFKRVRDLIGYSYDWEGIGGFMIKLLAWRLFDRAIVNPLHKTGDLFCSEFVTIFLQQVDGMYDEIMSLNPSGVAPGGDPKFLGTPSLRWELNRMGGDCIRIDPPWEQVA